VRVLLKGVHKVRRRLADGTEATYYYAWRGGPRIDAEPGTEAFALAYAAEKKKRSAPAKGLFFNLIAEFRSSAEFPKNKSTARAYNYYLKLIEEEFGDMKIEALADPAVRGDFKQWRDTMADRPRTADYAWTVLARVLSVAKDRGRITVNPCERGGRLYAADRADKIWTADDIKAFCSVASQELQAALLLAIWTGQRQTDLLRLTWTNYDGTHIRLRQGKGGKRGKAGKRVTIPVGEPLKEHLDEAKQKSTTILTNTYGEPWTSDGFRTSWGKAFDKAGLGDIHFHDLRGTAVTRLALAGCTVPEIAAITGHSLKDVEAILDAHYLGGKIDLAESAIAKLNAVYGSGTETVKRRVKRP
jgi:integrase